MTLKNQFKVVKDNWILVLLALFLIVVVSIGSNIGSSSKLYSQTANYVSPKMAMMDRGYDIDESYGEGFAPNVLERIKIHNARINTVIKRGQFDSAVTQVQEIVANSESYILEENVNKYSSYGSDYRHGYYKLKVPNTNFNSVLNDLKAIGEIESVYDNVEDITGTYTDLSSEIESEKQRLQRYQKMYENANEMEDKINLNDRIFEIEKRIKYLKENLEGLDQKITYSEIYFSMSEEQSKYARIMFVNFSDLIRTLVSSINALLTIFFVLLPWVFVSGVIYVLYRITRKN